MTGPAGYGIDAYIPAESSLAYQVRFENEATATAPARLIQVTDPLDPNLDLSTFQLTSIEFANQTITIPQGLDQYQAQVPMTTPTGASIVVNVDASLDRSTRTLKLTLQAFDPATGWYSEDPMVGLLYPEDGTNRGVGSISYLVKPLAGLPSGTVIQNRAHITFDYNDPIDTPLVHNTLDAAAPTSQVAPLPDTTTDTTFTVSWSGQDEASGSGIASYDIYVSVDGGAFIPWLTDTTDTSAIVSGQPGHTYSFYSNARDNVGHVEDAPAAPDATIQIVGAATTTTLQPSLDSPRYGDSLTFTATVAAGSPDLGTPTGTVEFLIDGTDFGSPITLINGSATSDPITTLGAGQHTISAIYSGDSTFTTSTADVLNLTVAKASLTFMADKLDMGHGDAIPGLTYTIQGFVNGETMSVVQGVPDLSTTASSASAAGRYPITVAAGTLAADNYDFNLVNGQLTVHPKVVDVRLDYGSKSISLTGLNRDLPFTTIKAIDIIFSDNVAVNMGQLSLTGVNVASYGLTGVSYDPNTNDATWTLPSALGVDRLMMALDGAAFAADPTISVNPFAAKFAVLPGDVNGDGVVNSQDMVLVRNEIQGTGDPSMIGWADLDGNGIVDINDYNAVRKNVGKHLY